MKSVVVAAPDDVRWTVRVAWEPRWRALARRFGGWRRNRKDNSGRAGDLVDGAVELSATPSSGGRGGGGFDLDDVVFVIAAIFIAFIAAAAMFWWVLLPLLLLVVDVVIIAALLVAALVGRLLFGRPWTVEATASNGDRLTSDVVGWRAALHRRDEMAESLSRGHRPVDLVSPVQ